MANVTGALPTHRPLPIILIRGFGGLTTTDDQKNAYQGFNDGSVYPQKRGENYIYEGMLLRFLKSDWRYRDATNVIGFYSSDLPTPSMIPPELKELDPANFSGRVLLDPSMALQFLRSNDDPCQTIWVFRYYDLKDRVFSHYGEALVRLIECIRSLIALKLGGEKPKVNIIAHSMGGLLVREAIQNTYPNQGKRAEEAINKIVTLGTPHKGISFQLLRDLRWLGIDSASEVEHFNPKNQEDLDNQAGWKRFHEYFPLERLLTVVGTNYHNYNVQAASILNRLFSVEGEYGANYNRSDGLVKQAFAQIDGAPRTFVHKCHAEYDSLISSRESFEAASRFFFGDLRVRLRHVSANIQRGFDFLGKSEFFFGVCVKPRGVDFDLFHQSKDAENCYGPFHTGDLSDTPANLSFPWADANRLIWEGYLNTNLSSTGMDWVMRVDFYVGERDLFGIGFSDNVVFYKQYYVRAIAEPTLQLYLYTGEEFSDMSDSFKNAVPMRKVGNDWEFDVEGTGFKGTYRIELESISEAG